MELRNVSTVRTGLHRVPSVPLDLENDCIDLRNFGLGKEHSMVRIALVNALAKVVPLH